MKIRSPARCSGAKTGSDWSGKLGQNKTGMTTLRPGLAKAKNRGSKTGSMRDRSPASYATNMISISRNVSISCKPGDREAQFPPNIYPKLSNLIRPAKRVRSTLITPLIFSLKLLVEKGRYAMRGSVSWQVTEVFKGINNLGTSKHEAKAVARTQGVRTWEQMGQVIGLHGQKTYKDYVRVAVSAFEYAKIEYGVRDITRLEGHMVQGFLLDKMQTGGRSGQGIERATYNTYSSAIHKLELALNRYSEVNGLGREYEFGLREVGTFAAEQLGAKNTDSRAYRDAAAVANAVQGKHGLLAKVIQESGARISEVANLRAGQLRGLKPDPHSGEIKGWIDVVGKGGKHSDKGVSPATYARLEKAIADGKANFNQSNFRGKLKTAAAATVQKYEGPHGLRWSWAQARHSELQRLGLSYESSLSIISKEMAHNRSDITCHYLH